MKTQRFLLAISILTVLFSYTSKAQSIAKLSLKESSVIVKGTSSLHDWRCKSEQISGETKFVASGQTLKDITSLNIKITVKSLKSIKENGDYYESGMDKNTYKALNADKFPDITYTLNDISGLKVSGSKAEFTAKGNLTIAGTKKEISFPVTATLNNGHISFNGSVGFKMTSFGVTPPKALLGTIKTGDDVTIVFNVLYN